MHFKFSTTPCASGKPFARKPLKVGTSVRTQRKTSQTGGKNRLRCSQNQEAIVVPGREAQTPCRHVQPSHSHAIVITQTSPLELPRNAVIVVAMLIIGIHVQLVVNHAELVAKLVILLMFADQNRELWPM